MEMSSNKTPTPLNVPGTFLWTKSINESFLILTSLVRWCLGVCLGGSYLLLPPELAGECLGVGDKLQMVVFGGEVNYLAA